METREVDIYLQAETTDMSGTIEDRCNRPISYQQAMNNHHVSTDNTNVYPIQTDNPYSVATNPMNSERLEHSENSTYSQMPIISEIPQNDTLINQKSHLSSTSSESSLLSRASGETCDGSRFRIHLICLHIIVTVILCVCITVLFVILSMVRKDLNNEKLERLQKLNTFCLPCNDLLLGPLEEDNENLNLLSRQIQDEIEICCAKGWNQTSIIMDLLFKRKTKLQNTQDILNSESNCKCNSTSNSGSEKTAGHLLAGLQPPPNGGSPYTVHNWSEEAPTAHASGIKVQDSQIIVNKSGLYLVYSQILFSNMYKGQSTVNTSQVLYHYVYRWNVIYPNGGQELLLKSVRTQCWAVNRLYGDYTSYTSGVFKLNCGDQLFVKASKLDKMSRDPHASFFGIAKL